MSASSSSLSVLSFNTWGLPLASKDTPERLRCAHACTTAVRMPERVARRALWTTTARSPSWRRRALADYLAGATAATTGAQGPPQVVSESSADSSAPVLYAPLMEWRP